MARYVNFVHSSPVGRAAEAGCPVKISCRVADHASVRISPVRPTGKGIEHGLVARRIQLVDDSATISPTCGNIAAVLCGSIQIPCRVADHTTIGEATVGPALETVEHSLVTGCVNPVHSSPVRGAAGRGSSIEISCRVANDTSEGEATVRSAREIVEYGLMPGWSHLEHNSA